MNLDAQALLLAKITHVVSTHDLFTRNLTVDFLFLSQVTSLTRKTLPASAAACRALSLQFGRTEVDLHLLRTLFSYVDFATEVKSPQAASVQLEVRLVSLKIGQT